MVLPKLHHTSPEEILNQSKSIAKSIGLQIDTNIINL